MHLQAKRNTRKPCPLPTVFIGIDWADKQHAFDLMTSSGEVLDGQFYQRAQAIDDWLAYSRRRFAKHQIAIVLEQSRGTLIAALLKYEDVQLFPINPGQLSKYRESMSYSGSKSDPVDAECEWLGYPLSNMIVQGNTQY